MMTTVLSLLTMVRIDYHAASEAIVPCIFLIQPSKILPKLAKPNNCKQNPFVSDKDRGALSCQFRSHFFHTFPNNGLTSQTCLVYVSENYKKNPGKSRDWQYPLCFASYSEILLFCQVTDHSSHVLIEIKPQICLVWKLFKKSRNQVIWNTFTI